jgi:hypothetical protein
MDKENLVNDGQGFETVHAPTQEQKAAADKAAADDRAAAEAAGIEMSVWQTMTPPQKENDRLIKLHFDAVETAPDQQPGFCE